MANYDQFSAAYDELMADVDYSNGAKGLLRLFERYDRKPTLLLDLACGTGGFSVELARQGLEVIGVDCSPGMLSVAAEKRQNAKNPLFLCQYAEELDLFGTVDGAICMLDSLNHLTEFQNFCQAMEKVSLFLEPGRLFIFDLNTPYKHRKILKDNTFIKESENAFCVWQNTQSGNLVEVSLDLFIQAGDLYQRLSEDFCERAYTASEIRRALQKAGLEPVDILDENGGAPRPNSERLIYITRKKTTWEK